MYLISAIKPPLLRLQMSGLLFRLNLSDLRHLSYIVIGFVIKSARPPNWRLGAVPIHHIYKSLGKISLETINNHQTTFYNNSNNKNQHTFGL